MFLILQGLLARFSQGKAGAESETTETVYKTSKQAIKAADKLLDQKLEEGM